MFQKCIHCRHFFGCEGGQKHCVIRAKTCQGTNEDLYKVGFLLESRMQFEDVVSVTGWKFQIKLVLCMSIGIFCCGHQPVGFEEFVLLKVVIDRDTKIPDNLFMSAKNMKLCW